MKEPVMKKILTLFRTYPAPHFESICSKCNAHHNTYNHQMQCHLKDFPLGVAHIPYPPLETPKQTWLQALKVMQNITINNNDNTTFIWTDASFDPIWKNGNGGMVLITKTNIQNKGWNLDHLRLTSSTRAGLQQIVKP